MAHEVPETAQAAKVPETTTEATETAQAAQVPETAQAAEVTETAHAAEVTETAQAAEVTETAQAAQMPETAQAVGVLETTQAANGATQVPESVSGDTEQSDSSGSEWLGDMIAAAMRTLQASNDEAPAHPIKRSLNFEDSAVVEASPGSASGLVSEFK